MKDFRLFDIYDFLMDDDFIRWVREGQNEDNEFWNNWLAQHPDKHLTILEAKRVLQTLGPRQAAVDDREKEIEVQKLLDTIGGQPVAKTETPVLLISPYRKWWYAAAVLFMALAATVSGLIFSTGNNTTVGKFDYATVIPSKQLIENVNTSGKPVKLVLPDESTVELGAGSRIAYANNFDSSGTRDVYLLGEAFFRVIKNPSRPFRVLANEIVTKVLGTSFTVRSFDKDSIIRVTVRTGNVSVYSQANTRIAETTLPNQLGGIILTPNQELVYKKSNREFKKTLLQDPVAITPTVDEKIMLYDDTPLEKVFAQLSRIYGINIVYDDDLLKKCAVTADLRGETFYRKLDLICKAVGADYEIIDGQVVVQSNGCQ
jgi:ferric-dicitrate binding protein FerR (iron transport regulator)